VADSTHSLKRKNRMLLIISRLDSLFEYACNYITFIFRQYLMSCSVVLLLRMELVSIINVGPKLQNVVLCRTHLQCCASSLFMQCP